MSTTALLARYGLAPDGTSLPETVHEVSWEQEQAAFTEVLPTILRVQRRYAQFTDLDDMRQEVWAWWLGKGRKYVVGYIAEESWAKLARSVYGVAVKYGEREKSARSGYRAEDNIVYSKHQIKDLLPVALDLEAFANTTPVISDGPKVHGNLAEGGNLLASVLDVRIAVEKLSPDDQAFLRAADRSGFDWSEIAEIYDIQPDSADQRYDRIAARIAKALSGETRS